MPNSFNQQGGENCSCDPEGIEVKRCPPVSCKLAGLLVSGYFCDMNGNQENLVTSGIHTEDINYNWSDGQNIYNVGRSWGVLLHFNGFIRSPVTGNVYFRTLSDDGIQLKINDSLLINQWQQQAPTYGTSQAIPMIMGKYYTIDIRYFQAGGGATFKVYWKYNDLDWQIIPGTSFYH